MQEYSKARPWSLFPSWMSAEDSEIWEKQLNGNLKWSQPIVCVYGNSYHVPRKTAFLAEQRISYRYSGTVHYGNGWPNWFYPLLANVNSACEVKFNGCLINLYRNGNDRMGWHSDNEPELDFKKPIASLSLGVARDFLFRNRTENLRDIMTLNSGDLLVMHPDCQINWQHSIPTRRKILGSRINLTFRCYKEDLNL